MCTIINLTKGLEQYQYGTSLSQAESMDELTKKTSNLSTGFVNYCPSNLLSG